VGNVITMAGKVSIDDTVPLVCVIESGEKVEDHVVWLFFENFEILF